MTLYIGPMLVIFTGKEVAEYCSKHMADMLLSNSSYFSSDFPTVLKELFIETDRKLLEKDVVNELKRYVAGVKEGSRV